MATSMLATPAGVSPLPLREGVRERAAFERGRGRLPRALPLPQSSDGLHVRIAPSRKGRGENRVRLRNVHGDHSSIRRVQFEVERDLAFPAVAVRQQPVLVVIELLARLGGELEVRALDDRIDRTGFLDRKSTRLNSSPVSES